MDNEKGLVEAKLMFNCKIALDHKWEDTNCCLACSIGFEVVTGPEVQVCELCGAIRVKR